MGIRTCQDLWDQRGWIWLLFSPKSAHFLLEASRGLGCTRSGQEIHESSLSLSSKSVSVERTLSPALISIAQMLPVLESLCQQLSTDLAGTECRTLTVKMKTVDFEVVQRGKTFTKLTSSAANLYRVAAELLVSAEPQSLRLLGVRASNLLKPEDDKHNSVEGQTDLTAFIRTGEDAGLLLTAQCPVCEGQLACAVDDLLRINAHLDECLGRKTEGTGKVGGKRNNHRDSKLDRFLCSKRVQTMNE